MPDQSAPITADALAAAPVPPPLEGPCPPGAEDLAPSRRNAGPLLAVLRATLPPQGTVLEIGTGTGQHAAAFAAALAPQRWLPTDYRPDRFGSGRLWADAVPGPAARPLPPRILDATTPPDAWPLAADDGVSAVLAVNVIHIAPWDVALGILAGAAHWLPAGEPLVLYGPYRRHGQHTGPGNIAFDASLRARDPSWGIRDLEGEVAPAAEAVGLRLASVQPMPADNLTVVFRRT